MRIAPAGAPIAADCQAVALGLGTRRLDRGLGVPPCCSQTLFPAACQAVAEGPRATERFAAVAAALVAGLAALARDAGVGARFAAALARRLEAALAARDSLAAGNLAAVAAQLYLVGLLPAGTLYGLLAHLRSR